MSSGFGESTKSASSSSRNSSNNGAADFECNICFDLPLDPVVTLCGHLFCWPCLYRWLHHRSRSHGCPLCKAIVEEQKLVPLYGKGKSVTDDPRLKSYLGMEIPPRPSGLRPQTVLEEDLAEEEEEGEEVVEEEEEEEEVVEEEEDPDVRTLLGRLEQKLDLIRGLAEQILERIEQRSQNNNN